MKYLSILSFLQLLLLVTGPSTIYAQEIEDEKELFMWVGAQTLQQEQPATLENMLLFARRFDIIPYSSGMNDEHKLCDFLSACNKLGISRTWIEVGPGKELTIRDFVEDASAREPVLDHFRKLAAIYKEYYPDFARITLFDEAPLGAFKRPEGQGQGNYTYMFEQFMEYGPRAFSYLLKAIKQVMPDAEVGIFMHHPHNASESMAGGYSSIDRFIDKCQQYDALPDFIFSDVYRGYFGRGYGMEETNAYIEDVARHTGEVASKYNIKAYQLGQMHTIKFGYTPSRMEIDQNVEAMIHGSVDGMGWYWPNYASTNYTRNSGDGIGTPLDYDISFDPFVPNAWGRTGPAGSVYATSRDRFVYSYLRMIEEIGSIEEETHFDIWIYGFDFDHAEHSIYLKTNGDHGNKWEMIGHFNPQHDKDAYEEGAREEYIYSYNNKWHAVVFHGLSRDRYLIDDGNSKKTSVKIVTSGGSDNSRLGAIYFMPYRMTRNYVTEAEVTKYIEKHPRWVAINCLVQYAWPAARIISQQESLILDLE
ncbi:MAG: hypothetical protein U9N72_02430 [Bacteroidota bacterium]|nr:hypothetical protein [Bacteroidota bacterium]